MNLTKFYKKRRLDSFGKNSFGSNKRIGTYGTADWFGKTWKWKAMRIKTAYEHLAKSRFELIRDFDEIQDISADDFSLIQINVSVEDDIITLEFDEVLPCQKIDDAYTSQINWRSMMTRHLKRCLKSTKTYCTFRRRLFVLRFTNEQKLGNT